MRSDRATITAANRLALSMPATAHEVAQFIAARAAACVGAEFSNVALLHQNGRSLRVFHDSALAADIAARYIEIPLDAPVPLAYAAQGHVVLLADLDAYRATFGALVDDMIAAGYQATASLPLLRDDGSPLGAIGFAWGEPTTFDSKLEAALRAVAHLCTQTIARAERYDAEHEFILALQDRLLRDLPAVAGLATAARYLPASRAPAVGGDWYEGLVVGGTNLAVVVGDLTGHGVAAAADMALVRGMISALVHAGIPTSDVFREVSGVLVQREELLLATAALAVFDVRADSVTFATAGHPPPLLLLPNGEVTVLSTANGPIIGIADARSVADTVAFPAGAQLVMYTDGLVERPDRPFYAGIEHARRHLTGLDHRLSCADLATSLLDTLIGSSPATDDIAIVIVERL